MRSAALALIVVACSSAGPRRVGSEPSWRHGSEPTATTVGPVTFAPTSEPETRYNEPPAAPPHSPLGDAVTAAIAQAAARSNLAAPVGDGRLFRACAELAGVWPEDGVLDYGIETFALQRNGIVEPTPRLYTVWGDVTAIDEIVDQLRPSIGEILGEGALRFGVAAVKRKPDGTGAVVFVAEPLGVTTTPIPRSVPAGGSFAIDAVVDARYHDPEIFVTRDDGAVERIALQLGHAGGFKAAILCGKHAGRQQVEILANNATGSTVLANFPVWCGEDPPLAYTALPTADDGAAVQPDEAEKRLLALTNRDRQAAGLPALLWDDRVAEVARKYSEEMRRTKVVAHVSPSSGAPGDRIRAAGIKTAVVLENVARAYGVDQAHTSLMNSPGHRANLMSQAATHVGIGVVLGDEVAGRHEMYLTEAFIRIPPKIDAGRVAELVRQRMEAARPVSVDVRLGAIAQKIADGVAAGRPREAMVSDERRELDALGNTYGRVDTVITAVADINTVEGKSLVADHRPDSIGVGVAQGTHPEIGDGAIWIVVLMAERVGAPPRK